MPKLFTVGYERTGQLALVQVLRDAGVHTVIDVRELPNSRRAGFSKRTLAASLAEAGIAYVHLKALGTPKEGRIANRKRDWKTFWKIVDTQLETEAAKLAFDHAEKLAREAPCCLLCLEADATVCHRARVAAELQRRAGFVIENLEVALSLA